MLNHCIEERSIYQAKRSNLLLGSTSKKNLPVEDLARSLSKLVRPFKKTWTNSRISKNWLSYFTKPVKLFWEVTFCFSKFRYWNFSFVFCVLVFSRFFCVLLGFCFRFYRSGNLFLNKLKVIWQTLFTRSWSLKLKVVKVLRFLLEIKNHYCIISCIHGILLWWFPRMIFFS